MATPPLVRRRQPKSPTHFNRSKSEYHENAPPPPLPPRDMYSRFGSSSTTPLSSLPNSDCDVPPPVPSTPRPNMNVQPQSPTWSGPKVVEPHLYPSENETFSLTELVTKHANLFPVKVRVTKGFFGERGEDSVIPVDEMYNMYFVKKAKVVTISDSSRSKYIVPLNSASKFGLIYQSPTVKSENHVFETVEDIILSSPHPKIVSTQVTHQGQDESTSIHKNEVLVIKGIHKPGRLRTMFRSNQEQLKVFSLKTMKEKLLPKNVFGRFTVDPQYTQLYLPELLNYVDDPVPSLAKLFLDYDSGDPLPDLLTSGTVQLESVDTEISIIASQVCDFEDEDRQISDDGAKLTDRMVDIPTTLDIEVSIIPPQEAWDESDYDYQTLYDDAMTLARDFDPHTLSRFDGAEDYSYIAQTRLFSAVRKGYEKEGMDIVFPNLKKRTVMSDSDSSDYIGPDDDYEECSFPNVNTFQPMSPPAPSTANPIPGVPPKSPRRSVADIPPPLPPARTSNKSTTLPSRNPSTDSEGITPLRLPPQKSLPPRKSASATAVDQPAPTLPTGKGSGVSSSDLPAQLEDLQKTISGITDRVVKLEEDSNEVSALKSDVQHLTPLVHQLQTSCNDVQVELGSLKMEVEELKLQLQTLSTSTIANQQSEETLNLEELSHQQVLQLLDSIKLQKYRAIFESKAIDGGTLAHCTEDMLISELLMSSRLDRIRLLKVINTGWVKLVPGADGGNYVVFEKTN